MRSGRREVLACCVAALAGACAPSSSASSPDTPPENPAPRPLPTPPFSAIESGIGGRVGVAAIDLQTGDEIGHRAGERFAMASTFKWLLAAAVLAAVDKGELTLAREVPFGEKDLLEYAPTTRASLAAGRLSIESLAKAIVVNSDNTAANLLFPLVGGGILAVLFVTTLIDSMDPDYGSGSNVGGVGLVFVLGVTVILVGVAVMIWQAVKRPAFFRGETLSIDAPSSLRRREESDHARR